MYGGMDRMDQQLTSYPITCCYLKAYKKIFCLFDMMFNAYVLYKITSQKVNFNQFKVVIPEKLNGWTDNA